MDANEGGMIVIGGSASMDLAKDLATALNCTFIPATTTAFPDGECYTRIEVEALDGAPGVFTARFGQMNGYGESHDAEANIHCLLDKLQHSENRHARFRTAIALVMDGQEHLFEGIVEGEILRQKSGCEGFGYDPVFAPEGRGVSFAEMPAHEKNAISHRGRAIEALVRFLLNT